MTETQPGPLASPPGHPDLDTLADFGADVLDPAQTTQLRTHVDTCARCQGVLAGSDAVPDLLRTLPPVAMPAAVEARIFAALDAERQARGAVRPPGHTASVASLDVARARRRGRIVALSKVAAGVAIVVGLGAGIVAISSGTSTDTANNGGGSAAGALNTLPQAPKDSGPGIEASGTLPSYDRQTITQSSLLTDILNGKGPLTPVPPQAADRLRGCEQAVTGQVPGLGTSSPLAAQHIKFEGTPAYLLVYGGSQRTLVVVADTCTQTSTQVLFTKPL